MALHFLAEAAFDDLLAAWRHYDDLRSVDKPMVTKLGPARIQLDEARARMYRLRSVLYPTDGEREAVIATALCSVLDEVVHLNASHRVGKNSDQLRCICGELVATSSTCTPSMTC